MRRDLEIIAEWIRPGSHVLDLGCGDGTLLAHLCGAKSCTGYGLEIDPDNIARCIARGVDVIQTDLDRGLEEFESDGFDYVVMTQSLQALHFPDRVLEEMLRIGREAVTSFPNMGHWKCRLQLAVAGHMPVTRTLPHHWYDTPNIHLCTVHDFERLCAGRGYEVLERAALDRHHRLTPGARLLPNLLGESALFRFRRAAGHGPAAVTV
ncbi:MAG: methionine biosynthesis protein MetW [Halofilum sp. (in: g-proteobacteria)]|nr:methionine biosynthesis protein MetW [Halofilum sp. (in: g-proteobacteria)]